MRDIVKKVVDEWNPCGLLPHAPDNEFNAEIEKVTESLKNVNRVKELALNVQRIFSSRFGKSFKYERCLAVAQRIWAMVNEQQ